MTDSERMTVLMAALEEVAPRCATACCGTIAPWHSLRRDLYVCRIHAAEFYGVVESHALTDAVAVMAELAGVQP